MEALDNSSRCLDEEENSFESVKTDDLPYPDRDRPKLRLVRATEDSRNQIASELCSDPLVGDLSEVEQDFFIDGEMIDRGANELQCVERNKLLHLYLLISYKQFNEASKVASEISEDFSSYERYSDIIMRCFDECLSKQEWESVRFMLIKFSDNVDFVPILINKIGERDSNIIEIYDATVGIIDILSHEELENIVLEKYECHPEYHKFNKALRFRFGKIVDFSKKRQEYLESWFDILSSGGVYRKEFLQDVWDAHGGDDIDKTALIPLITERLERNYVHQGILLGKIIFGDIDMVEAGLISKDVVTNSFISSAKRGIGGLIYNARLIFDNYKDAIQFSEEIDVQEMFTTMLKRCLSDYKYYHPDLQKENISLFEIFDNIRRRYISDNEFSPIANATVIESILDHNNTSWTRWPFIDALIEKYNIEITDEILKQALSNQVLDMHACFDEEAMCIIHHPLCNNINFSNTLNECFYRLLGVENEPYKAFKVLDKLGDYFTLDLHPNSEEYLISAFDYLLNMGSIDFAVRLMKLPVASGIDFAKIDGFEEKVKKSYIEYFSKCIKEKSLLSEYDFLINFGKDLDFTEERKYIFENHPAEFVYGVANRDDWRMLLGDKVFSEFLNVLPTKTDEKRNAFTRNEYDRTTKFMNYLADKQGSSFSLESLEFSITTEYVRNFGLSKSDIIFDCFRNIMLLENEQIDALPEWQIESNVTTIDELKEAVSQIENILFCNTDTRPIDLSKLNKIQLDLLGMYTGVSSHSFSRSSNVEYIIRDFQENFSKGKVDFLPAEYRSFSIEMSDAKVIFDSEVIKDDYDVLSSEIFNSLDSNDNVDYLRDVALKAISNKKHELESILERSNNPHIQSQLSVFQKIENEVNSANDLDSLIIPLLSVEKKVIKKIGLDSVLRSIVFQKIFIKRCSPEAIENLVSKLRDGISADGVLALLNIVNGVIKNHVLNLSDGNKEGYWEKGSWSAIRKAKTSNNLINIQSIFSPYIGNLSQAAKNFEVKKGDNNQSIEVVPDRGVIGEMSGYLANACYTAQNNLLKRFPNLVPFKFIVGEGEDKKFGGSALVFEVMDARLNKVMIVRAFNFVDESEIDIGAFYEEFLDNLVPIAQERGIKKILVPNEHQIISNYHLTSNYVVSSYVDGKKPVKLLRKFDFNNYDITKKCYVAREIR